MRRLMLLGLNHTTAPLEVREKIAFNSAQQQDAMQRFREKFPHCECVLVSTCNRVELYTARSGDGEPGVRETADFLAGFHQIAPESLRGHLYHKTERAVIEHLFHVTSSLDSMVLGETQILGQVRDAYDLAKTCSATGAFLNPLFQRAIAVGKQVMHDTALAEGRLSVASVAVDYASRIFERFDDKTVLSIGAGKMAVLSLQHFANLHPQRLLICNRDSTKADALAQQFNGTAVAFANLLDHLTAADIVITSTGSTQPIITRTDFESVMKRRRYRPIFLIDIALPRDVEAEVAQLENVYLYNLDDLQQVVSATQSTRRHAIEAAEAIIAQHVDDFVIHHRAREIGPVIEQLHQRYHAMAKAELERTLNKFPNISEAERAHLEDLARRIVNKILHEPITALRKGGSAHEADGAYLHAMEKLFGIEKDRDDQP